MNPPPLPQTGDFRLEHIADCARHRRLLRTLKVGNGAEGLAAYLKKWALRDEVAGGRCLCAYALPERKLLEHYGTLGFSRLPPEHERFVHERVKPAYDKGCVFMF